MVKYHPRPGMEALPDRETREVTRYNCFELALGRRRGFVAFGRRMREIGGRRATPPPPQVSVAQVLEKRVKDWDEFTGRLQAVETVEIRPRVSGYIDKVAFTEGS